MLTKENIKYFWMIAFIACLGVVGTLVYQYANIYLEKSKNSTDAYSFEIFSLIFFYGLVYGAFRWSMNSKKTTLEKRLKGFIIFWVMIIYKSDGMLSSVRNISGIVEFSVGIILMIMMILLLYPREHFFTSAISEKDLTTLEKDKLDSMSLKGLRIYWWLCFSTLLVPMLMYQYLGADKDYKKDFNEIAIIFYGAIVVFPLIGVILNLLLIKKRKFSVAGRTKLAINTGAIFTLPLISSMMVYSLYYVPLLNITIVSVYTIAMYLLTFPRDSDYPEISEVSARPAIY